MRKEILVAGFACLSLIAVAQSNGTSDQPSSAGKVVGSRETASGHASGKQAQGPKLTGGESSASSVRESPSKASLRESPTRHTTAVSTSDDASSVRESPSKASLRESPTRQTVQVSAGDVDGDGRADRPIGSQSSGSGAGVAINNSHSNIKSPRDSATGQASGKVNVQDISITKRSKSSAAEEPKK